MRERRVPYRSFSYSQMESNALFLMYCVVLFVIRFVFDRSILETLAALLFTVLVFTPLANAWARWRGREMISSSEAYLRFFRELSELPLVSVLAYHVLINLQFVAAAVIFMIPMVSWLKIAPIAGCAAIIIGVLHGLWHVSFARRALKMGDAPEGGQQASLSNAEIWRRHYVGHVSGLAAGLGASSAFDKPLLATVALVVAFFVVKPAVNKLLPVCINLSFELPPFRIREIFMNFVSGALWWGVPYGLLAIIAIHNYAPQARLDRLAAGYAGFVLMGGVLMTFVASFNRLSAWTPGARRGSA